MNVIRYTLILLIVAASAAAGLPIAAAESSCADYPISNLELKSTSDTPLEAVRVSADTTLDDTDSFDNNPGEPYLQVDIDGEQVVQTDVVERSDNYDTTLQIPQSAVDSLDPGEHEVTVILWDKDDSIDDNDLGNDDAICERTKTFQVEETVTSQINSVDVADGSDEDGDGYYSDITLNIQATTSLEDSDTSGNNPGEPYFQVEIGDSEVRTTEIVQRSEDGSYRVEISQEDLQSFKHGQYDIQVEFWDKDDSIDDTDSGNDDAIDEWKGSIKIERPLKLRVSRSTTVVGSPVAFQLTGAAGSGVSWKIVDQPDGSDVRLFKEHRHTVSFRPVKSGQYKIAATPEGSSVTKTATVTVQDSRDIELLRKFSPRIYYHQKERYFPTRYESFIYNSRLQQVGGDNIENPTVFDLQGKSGWELDLKGSTDEFVEYQDDYPSTVYGSVHENVEFRGDTYTAVTYWLFYVYDPKQSDSLAALLAHQSDLETVTILLQDGNPEWVGVSQHYGGELREWSKAPKKGSHVKIYPALGAHSNYLRNTENYSQAGIPIQEQFIQHDSTNVSLVDSPLDYVDKTGDDVVYSNTGSGNVEYQIVPLTGNEIWASYEGSFNPNDDAGSPPFDRQRWKQPGRWMEKNLVSDEKQIQASLQSSQVSVSSEGVQSSLTVANNGPKPHPVWVVVESKPVSSSWDSSHKVVLYEKPVFVGVGGTEKVVFQVSPPDQGGSWNVRVRLTAYPPTLVDAVKVFAQVTSEETIFVETPTPTSTPTPTATTNPESTVSSGDLTTVSGKTSTVSGQTGPGFSIVVTVMVLLGGALLARRV